MPSRINSSKQKNNYREPERYDYVVIGSGFGGSVSAMRLSEKGYKVLVLERGKRFSDKDFPKTNWNIWKYLWRPSLRCFGIQEITFLKGMTIYHGSGVGGGSLVYASVLMEPDSRIFDSPSWSHLADWKTILRPHFDTAKQMLGVTPNPRLWFADEILKQIAEALGQGDTFCPTNVGIFFADPGKEGEIVPDPYFNGEGPSRKGCIHCGACMVGCRQNAKNDLTKNYLYFAEKNGALVKAEAEVVNINPLGDEQPDCARYEVIYKRPTAWLSKNELRVRACNVVVSAGTLGTLKLLFHCRDITLSLPKLSQQLGNCVRTNNEAMLGAQTRDKSVDFTKGIAITSIIQIDKTTVVEPVRYPQGSSLASLFKAPLINTAGRGLFARFLLIWKENLLHFSDWIYSNFANFAKTTTILLVMQNEDNLMQFRLGRKLFGLFPPGLEYKQDEKKTIPGSYSHWPPGNAFIRREDQRFSRGQYQ